MTGTDPDGSADRTLLWTGAGLVVAAVLAAGLTAAGVTVTAGGYDLPALAAGAIAIAFCVWGLLSATRGAYRQGVGALSGSAGLVLVFLAPEARSPPLFVGTGALIVAASGLFLIAQGLGYELIAVDDTDEFEEDTAEQVDAEPET